MIQLSLELRRALGSQVFTLTTDCQHIIVFPALSSFSAGAKEMIISTSDYLGTVANLPLLFHSWCACFKDEGKVLSWLPSFRRL